MIDPVLAGQPHPVLHTHRFVYTSPSGSQHGESFEFRNDAAATVCARSLLSRTTVAIAVRRIDRRGRMTRVGLWVWNHGDPEWKPDE